MNIPWKSLIGLIGSLVKPAAESVFNDIARRWNIVRRLSARDLSTKENKIIEKAIADLQIVFGKEGQLTERLAQLLTELRDSGFLALLARDAFFELRDAGVRFHFEVIFSRIYGESLNASDASSLCDSVFKTIWFILKESIRSQMIPSLLFLVDISKHQRQHESNGRLISEDKIIERQLALIKPEIKNTISAYIDPFIRRENGSIVTPMIRAEYPAWFYIDSDTINDSIKSACAQLEARYRSIPLEGPSEKSQLCDIEKVYINSSLSAASFSAAQSVLEVTPTSTTDFSDMLLKPGTASIVLGDPGGGKSTLGQWKCFENARLALAEANPRLAFKVEVRRFQPNRFGSGHLGFLAFIVEELGRQINEDLLPIEIRDLVTHCLVFGRLVLVLDGIDEVISGVQRRTLVAEITQFCLIFGHNTFVITSRVADFRVTPIIGFPIFVLQPLSISEIEKYYANVSEVVFHVEPLQLPERCKNFLKEARRHASEFIINPLLLALIVWIFNMTKRIPDNRIEIYSECSELLFSRWDALKEIEPNIPDQHRLVQLVAHIARAMFLQEDVETEHDAAWVRRRAKEFFLHVYDIDKENRAQLASREFVKHLVGRSWILQERLAGVFEFTHRTFMEYFFARYLDDAHRDIDSLFAFVRARIVAGEWTIPIHLSFQLKAAGKLRTSERLTELLIDLLGDLSQDDKADRQNIGRFVCESIGYLQPTESRLVAVTKAVTSFIKEPLSWYDMIGNILTSPSDFHEAIVEGVYQSIADEIYAGDVRRFGHAFDWLYASYLGNRTDCSIDFSDHIVRFSDLRDRFLRRFYDLLRRIQNPTEEVAKLLFDLTGQVLVPEVTKAGLLVWERPVSLGERLDWRYIDFALGVRECSDVIRKKRDLGDASYVQLFSTLAATVADTAGPIHIDGILVVDFIDLGIGLDLIPDLRLYSREIGAAFAIALIGYAELEDAISSEPEERVGVVRALLRELILSEVIEKNVRNYVESWLSGQLRMFVLSGRQRVEHSFSVFRRDARTSSTRA